MQDLGADDPRWIGEYRLLRRLGAGGMGRVYLGRTAGGRTVAVKQVRSEFAADHEFRVRFRQEVAAARRVGGRWTAPVLDADTEGPMPWVATGYVAGPSLHAAVHEFGPLPSGSVRVLGTGLAEALTAVHALGLVHRDVKPSNVMLALDGPRLIDFGISRALDAASPLTRTGFLVGSPGYLSPEQARGVGAGAASDVFSLGAVLAFAAQGTPPFGENVAPATLLYRVLHEDPDLRGVDAELHETILACLAKDPAARPTPDQLRARLDTQGAAALRLGREGWLPPAVSSSVGRLAVELLDLDTVPGVPAPGPDTDPTRPFSQMPMTQAAAQAPPVPPTPPMTQGPGAQPPTPPTAMAQPHFAQNQNPAAPATMSAQYGAQPPWPPAGPGPTAQTPARTKQRGQLIAGGAAAAVAVAVIGIWAASSGSSKTPSTSGPSKPTTTRQLAQAAGSHPAAPTAPAGVIPGAFLGTWQGEIGSATIGPLAFEITFSQGVVGGKVAHIQNDGGGVTCDADAQLVSASGAQVVLTTIASSVSSLCEPITAPQFYTLNSDGTLLVSLAGLEGELAKG